MFLDPRTSRERERGKRGSGKFSKAYVLRGFFFTACCSVLFFTKFLSDDDKKRENQDFIRRRRHSEWKNVNLDFTIVTINRGVINERQGKKLIIIPHARESCLRLKCRNEERKKLDESKIAEKFEFSRANSRKSDASLVLHF